jgi:hypothetical protein
MAIGHTQRAGSHYPDMSNPSFLESFASDVPGLDSHTVPSYPGKKTLTQQIGPSINSVADRVASVLQRRGDGAAGVADSAEAESAVATASSSTGAPLRSDVRERFEGSLGADLSGVRVHTGDDSAAAAKSVGAKAYATGNDIHFAQGMYQPDDPFGLHLLAHEVAHTVQQSGGGFAARQHKLEVSEAGDAAEVEADHAADAMVHGAPAIISSASGIQRKIFREASETAPTRMNPKMSIDLPDIKFGDGNPKPFFTYLLYKHGIKRKVSIELVELDGKGAAVTNDTMGAAGSKDGVGLKHERVLAEQKLSNVLPDLAFDAKAKEKLTFQFGSDQVKVSIGVEGRSFLRAFPQYQGAVDLTINLASVKWEDLKKDPSNFQILGVEAAFGIAGDVVIPTSESTGVKLNGTVQYAITAFPNWPMIVREISQRLAAQGAAGGGAAGGAGGSATSAAGTGGSATSAAGTGGSATSAAGTGGSATSAAGTGGSAAPAATANAAPSAVAAGAAETEVIVLDTGPAVASAAAIVVPLAAAAMMIAGAVQEDKNTVASRAAIAAGNQGRIEARAYAKAYAKVLTGGTASGQGAIDAEAKVQQVVGSTGKSRADACAALDKAGGGFAKIQSDILAKLLPQIYEKLVAEFEAKFADRFGVLEKIGETWGMRGTFRNDLRRLLWSVVEE